MVDIDLIKSICNSECSLDTIIKYDINIEENRYDYVNSFEKYYNINNIIKVIKKYQNNEINDTYLSSWANSYNWIIMASSWKNRKKRDNSHFLRDLIIYEISSSLDSLSFFDSMEDEYYNYDSLNSYIEDFIFLDSTLKNIDDYKEIYYTSLIGKFYDKGESNILAINHKDKKFIRFKRVYFYDNKNNLTAKEMSNMIHSLNKQGYSELK